jgi:hypothetical protein
MVTNLFFCCNFAPPVLSGYGKVHHQIEETIKSGDPNSHDLEHLEMAE